MASGSSDGTLKLWDMTTMQAIANLAGHRYRIRSVALSPDGKLVASASGEQANEGSPLEPGEVKLWNAGTGKELATFAGLTNVVRSLAFSPDGGVLALAAPYAAELWDVTTLAELAMLSGTRMEQRQHEHVTSVAFSPDGDILAVGSETERIELWDVPSRKLTGELNGIGRGVECVAFSHDGKYLTSGGQDLLVSVWDVRARKRLAALPGHKTFTVSAVAFAPDGKTVTSGGWDGAVRLWSTSARRELGSFDLHAGKILSLAFSTDGTSWCRATVTDQSGFGALAILRTQTRC